MRLTRGGGGVEISEPRFEKHLLVCENERENGSCCGKKDSGVLREALKKQIKEMGFSEKIRVSRTGCLDVCDEGPNILLMPDNVWFSHVEMQDLPEIVRRAVDKR